MLCSKVNEMCITSKAAVVSGRCGSLKYQNVAKTKLLTGNPLWMSTLIAGLENAMKEWTCTVGANWCNWNQLRNHNKKIGWWLAAGWVSCGGVNWVTKFGHNSNRFKVHSEQLELLVACITLVDGTRTGIGMCWQLQTHSLHAIHARHNTCRYKMHTTHTIYVTYTLPQSS